MDFQVNWGTAKRLEFADIILIDVSATFHSITRMVTEL